MRREKEAGAETRRGEGNGDAGERREKRTDLSSCGEGR